MSTRFVKFVLTPSNIPIYINRSMVRTVRVTSDPVHSALGFDKDHIITVDGTPEDVVQQLEDDDG